MNTSLVWVCLTVGSVSPLKEERWWSFRVTMGGSIYNYIGLGVYPGNLKVEVHDNYNVGGGGGLEERN